MPTSPTHIKKLVDRLVTLPSAQNGMFEKTEDERKAVRTELGKALERYTRSDSHAGATVDRLMEGKFRPVPGEIREAAAATMPATEARLPDHCTTCNGRPWLDGAVITEDAHGRKTVESRGARRCGCALGQYLAAKDAERQAEEAAKV